MNIAQILQFLALLARDWSEVNLLQAQKLDDSDPLKAAQLSFSSDLGTAAEFLTLAGERFFKK